MIRRFLRWVLGITPRTTMIESARYDVAGFQIDNELGGVVPVGNKVTTEQRLAVLEANARAAANPNSALVGDYWVRFAEAGPYLRRKVTIRHCGAAAGRWYDADTLLAIADEIRRQQELHEKERIAAEDRASQPFERLARETAAALRRQRDAETREAVAREILLRPTPPMPWQAPQSLRAAPEPAPNSIRIRPNVDEVERRIIAASGDDQLGDFGDPGDRPLEAHP